MFKALKMKIAARRMERKRNVRKSSTKKARRSTNKSFWNRVWNTICAPFRAISRWFRAFWKWICRLDLVGMVNIALLSAIIVLFSMLIIDVIGCNKRPVVIVTKRNAPQITMNSDAANRTVRQRTPKIQTLPIKKDANRNFIGKTIDVMPVRPDKVAIQQTARCKNTMYGDVIIDSRGAATMLKPASVVKGNLYLQHMRKYTLPRGVRIEGNLFLRNMGMLQFGGEFTVTGNIYVTPDSSFGPIPGNARIGGQVIL